MAVPQILQHPILKGASAFCSSSCSAAAKHNFSISVIPAQSQQKPRSGGNAHSASMHEGDSLLVLHRQLARVAVGSLNGRAAGLHRRTVSQTGESLLKHSVSPLPTWTGMWSRGAGLFKLSHYVDDMRCLLTDTVHQVSVEGGNQKAC